MTAAAILQMGTLRKVTGEWRGTRSDKPSGISPGLEPLPFTLTLKQGWFGQFTGSMRVASPGGMADSGLVDGRVSFPQVEFTVRMPVGCDLSADGPEGASSGSLEYGRTPDQEARQRVVSYLGEFSSPTHAQGTWVMNPAVLPLGDGRILDPPERRGTWTIDARSPVLRVPQTAWCPKTAWGAVLALVMLSFSFTTLLQFLVRSSPAAHKWLASPVGWTTLDVLRPGFELVVIFLLAGGGSVRTFAARAGLTRKPSTAGWLAAWLGMAIGLLELYFIGKGWQPANSSAVQLQSSGDGHWFSYLLSALLIAPLYEEMLLRGYLYRAFRSSYTISASTLCVTLVVGYLHRSLLANPLSFAALMAGTWLLCLVRERTVSTWNCILFHAAHNATVSLQWSFLIGGMLLALPFCMRSNSVCNGESETG